MHSLISGLARDQHSQCSLGPLTYYSNPIIDHLHQFCGFILHHQLLSQKIAKHTCLTPKFHKRNNCLSASCMGKCLNQLSHFCCFFICCVMVSLPIHKQAEGRYECTWQHLTRSSRCIKCLIGLFTS
jgi:hypothetical protein